MKKCILKILKPLFLFIGMISVLLLFSCDGVIFNTIREEVSLSDAEVSGIIQNIVRYTYAGKECAFITNGEILYRSIVDTEADYKSDWNSFSTPSGYVYSLAADNSNLYAMAVTIEEDDDGYNVPEYRNLWCYNGSSWSLIWSEVYTSTYAFIICTNSVKPNNRKAYFRYGAGIVELTGSAISSSDVKYVVSTDGSILSNTMKASTEGGFSSSNILSVSSCASLGSDIYFSTGRAMASNKDDSVIYYSSGGTVYYTDGSSLSGSASVTSDTIMSMGVTSDYLLLGTDEGIQHTTWATTNVPSSGTADFSTNADSTLSSYYEVPAILVVDPSLAETGGTIYASGMSSSSSASFKNIGLWGYYANEGEWNRE